VAIASTTLHYSDEESLFGGRGAGSEATPVPRNYMRGEPEPEEDWENELRINEGYSGGSQAAQAFQVTVQINDESTNFDRSNYDFRRVAIGEPQKY
jgi:hypothetical protein